MKKGQIVLILFPFTDLSGSKLRPAYVLAETLSDVTVLFITSQTTWQEPTDTIIYPDSINGIKKNSIIKASKIVTLDKGLVKGILGTASKVIEAAVDVQLKAYMKLK